MTEKISDVQAFEKLLHSLNEFFSHVPDVEERSRQQAIEVVINTVAALLWGRGYDRLLVHRTLAARGFAGVATLMGPEPAAVFLEELAKDLRAEPPSDGSKLN